MSTIQTNLAKWYESAAWFHAWPAVSVRPCVSASRARSACMSPFATQAGSHSGQVSTPDVTRWKSLKSTPCETKRGAQFAIAACTRSSGTCGSSAERCEQRVVGQVRGVAAQVLEICARHLLLDVVPVSVGELVRMEADDLERVLSLRCALGIGDRRAHDEQRWIVGRDHAATHVVADAQQALYRIRGSRGDRSNVAEPRRL